MANNDDDDYIFGRLQNELKQIAAQKKRAQQRKRESKNSWLADLLITIGKAIGKIITFPFDLIYEMIKKLKGPKR